jgi:hypothetical protein
MKRPDFIIQGVYDETLGFHLILGEKRNRDVVELLTQLAKVNL